MEKKQERSNVQAQQPEVNIGLVGHVDHGKTSLVKVLSGLWTDTHSEELKRGITIKLGYADATFYKCEKCKAYGVQRECSLCKGSARVLRTVSFIDAPGHESLMATMLSGAAIMDGAVLLVAANESCPQPQTKEHVMALEIMGLKHIVIAQNKIDLVSEKEALDNYKEIKAFVKGTIAENAPIIPISAQHNVNIGPLIEVMETVLKTPNRGSGKEPLMLVARSFDVNKPGTDIKVLSGGVIGGALREGVLVVGDDIEIRPGFITQKEERYVNEAIVTKLKDIKRGGVSVKSAGSGGSLGVMTSLDPSYVKSDALAGSLLGKKGNVPPVWSEFKLKPTLLDRVVGSKEDMGVDAIKKGETLMLNVNAAATVGVVRDVRKDMCDVVLKLPVCCAVSDRITISRMVGNRWRLIGFGNIIQ